MSSPDPSDGELLLQAFLGLLEGMSPPLGKARPLREGSRAGRSSQLSLLGPLLVHKAEWAMQLAAGQDLLPGFVPACVGGLCSCCPSPGSNACSPPQRCFQSQGAAAPGWHPPQSCMVCAWCRPTSWRPSRMRTTSSAA